MKKRKRNTKRAPGKTSIRMQRIKVPPGQDVYVGTTNDALDKLMKRILTRITAFELVTSARFEQRVIDIVAKNIVRGGKIGTLVRRGTR